MIRELKKNLWTDPGSSGLPEDYPRPPHHDDLLFYIQRSQNRNTVVYEVNRNASNQDINLDFPMRAYWIRYTDGGEIVELNHYQKLAYGYESKMINHYAFEFNFVSSKDMKFFISKSDNGLFQVKCRIDGKMAKLDHIYVYAEELGVFPNVKFIEFYGKDLETGRDCYQKINIEA